MSHVKEFILTQRCETAEHTQNIRKIDTERQYYKCESYEGFIFQLAQSGNPVDNWIVLY